MALASPSRTASGTSRRRDAWPWACVLAYVALCAALLIAVPLAKTPDESAHWEYIEHIATLRSLPVFEGTAPPNPGYEFHQPPLYYLLAAPAWAALPAGVQQCSARVVSLVCGAIVVWLVFAAARAMFAADGERGERMARRAGALAALWPLHVALGAMSNNDGLGGLCAAALFWRVALLANRAPTVRDGAWIGVLCGLGLLSKSTTLVVSVACVAALWHLSRRAQVAPSATPLVLAAGGKPKQAAASTSSANPSRVLGVCVVASLLVCGWMLARNTILYGDPLAFRAFKEASNAATLGLDKFALMGYGAGDYIRNVAVVGFATAWGIYGGPSLLDAATRMFSSQPTWWSGWPSLAALVLLAASTCALIRLLAGLARVAGRLRNDEGTSRDVVWMWWGVGCALIGLAYLQFALTSFSGAQGRYLHVALLPACVAIARAWDDLPARWRGAGEVLVALTLVALTVANVLVWRTLV